MKSVLLASTALVVATRAMAADLPPRMPVKAAPVVVARPYSWTGCYVGGHIGADWGRTSISEPNEPFLQYFAPANTPTPVDSGSDFLGGVQVGCDYQFATHWVVGAAGDFSWTNLEGQATDPFFAGKTGGPITFNTKTEWLATATARVGYAWDRWMFYGKGGAAWAHNRDNIQNLGPWGNPTFNVCVAGGIAVGCNPTGTETRLGWTVGLGFEWAFADHWSTGLEFDHYDFGSHSLTLSDPNGFNGIATTATGPISVKQRVEALKLSINYRFGGP
jgi:outer membrane immunogenic protein